MLLAHYLERPDLAIEAFQRALSLCPDFLFAAGHLQALLFDERKGDDLLAMLEKLPGSRVGLHRAGMSQSEF